MFSSVLIKIVLLWILPITLLAQYYPASKHWDRSRTYTNSIEGTVTQRVNRALGDTAKYYNRSKEYIEYSKEGIVLAEGLMVGGEGSPCSCGLAPYGYWTTRYRNGVLKAQGKYACYKKIGTWVTYHENGQIAEIAHYKRPYAAALTERHTPGSGLSKQPLLADLYLAYYPNGQLKTAGNYEIVEELSNVDTLYKLDIETLEVDTTVIEGTFWNPVSKKSGYWVTYVPDGTILWKRNYALQLLKDKTIRPIKLRETQLLYDFKNK